MILPEEARYAGNLYRPRLLRERLECEGHEVAANGEANRVWEQGDEHIYLSFSPWWTQASFGRDHICEGEVEGDLGMTGFES